MIRLTPVDVAALAPASPQITDDEAAASFRAAVRLFSRWGLTDEQAALLLDIGLRSYRRWKMEGPGRLGRDGKAIDGEIADTLREAPQTDNIRLPFTDFRFQIVEGRRQ